MRIFIINISFTPQNRLPYTFINLSFTEQSTVHISICGRHYYGHKIQGKDVKGIAHLEKLLCQMFKFRAEFIMKTNEAF
jgi:hypothetical protein